MATILVVDDEPMMLRLCTRMLEHVHRVLTAGGGEQALQVLQNNSIDLALLDVLMPGMNGIELAHRIVRVEQSAKILLISGYGAREISNMTGAQNPYPIIWKPFKSESLVQSIENLLMRS